MHGGWPDDQPSHYAIRVRGALAREQVGERVGRGRGDGFQLGVHGRPMQEVIYRTGECSLRASGPAG